MAYVKMSYIGTLSAAQDIKSIAEEIEQLGKCELDTARETEVFWEGIASDEYRSKAENLAKGIMKISDMLRKVSDDIKLLAESVKDADEKTTVAAEDLNGNF